MAYYKAGLKCGRCKAVVHPCVLDFDHEGGKRDGVSNLVNHGAISTLLKELTKVVARCASCHRLKTHAPEEYRKIKTKDKPPSLRFVTEVFRRWEDRCWRGSA